MPCQALAFKKEILNSFIPFLLYSTKKLQVQKTQSSFISFVLQSHLFLFLASLWPSSSFSISIENSEHLLNFPLHEKNPILHCTERPLSL